MPGLQGKVALVTGATRGVGRGVVIELANAGATVYATGRSIDSTTFSDRKSVVPLKCDHTIDDEVDAVFRQMFEEQQRIDILVNNVWAGYENMIENGEFSWMRPFWQQSHWRWDAMFAGGVRAHYVASAQAAKKMVEQHSGLIVNISFWAAQKHIGNVPYGASKAATDKLTSDMAHELREYNVAAVSLYPGMVRTEKVMEAAPYLDLSNSESPEFIGRAVVALAGDPNIMKKSGEVLIAAALAQEYGFTDVDGKQPRPLTINDV